MESKRSTPWTEIAVAVTPILLAVVSGTFLLYGQIQELNVSFNFIQKELQRQSVQVYSDLEKHSRKAAHGTVREVLTKHGTMLASHQARVKALELHAAVGERYTEDDAKEDLARVHNQLHLLKREILDIRTRGRNHD